MRVLIACEFSGIVRDAFAALGHVTRHDARPTQTIQPFDHGHGETKQTGLWLRGLPLLKPTHIVTGRTPRVHFASPGPNRWKERSRTLPGIAQAMAAQWGNLE